MRHVAEGNMPPTDERPGGPGALRQLVDSLVCLALAVVLFRTFQVEGYMISTGSMAPTLLGFHKRVVCPSCRHEFAFGVAFDDDYDGGEEHATSDGVATCPNCGLGGIEVDDVPRNQGDQLLVHKGAYLLHDPRRWEVVVFRNPYKTTQAYVKRIAGLPGEAVTIRHGDVHADDALQRKDFVSQRAVRVLVYDHGREPQDDPAWGPRWLPQDGPATWRRDGQAFVLDEQSTSVAPSSADWTWLSYRHWIRSGGNHETAVTLPPLDVATFPEGWMPVRYDAATRRLTCYGALSDADLKRLLLIDDDPEYAAAIRDLAERSHVAPITDQYGYNRSRGGVPPVWVRDLMLSARLAADSGDGAFSVQMTDGEQIFDCVIDVGRREVRLVVDGNAIAARTASLPAEVLARPMRLEMSLFDRQVLVAINGKPVLDPLHLPEPGKADPPRWPVRIGARGLAARVDELVLYRDVHYTSRGNGETFSLGDEEYLVLGDNSPVSHDSRRWPQPAVDRRLFLGRPFVVHLPSRQAELTIGGRSRYIRVPDLARIRYIR